MSPAANVRQRGQAMTEFLVAGIALVPILLMMPVLGKLSDANHTAIEASRYAAWETTVATEQAKDLATITSETQRRFFEHPDVFVQTGDGATGQPSDQNRLWSVNATERLVKSSTDSVSVGITRESDPGAISSVISDGLNKMASIGRLFDDDLKFDVERHGLVTARVGVDIASNRFGFDPKLSCSGAAGESFTCIARHNVILTDSWDAADANQAEARAKPFVPAAVFEGLSKITDVVAKVPFLEEWGRLEPGKVDPEVVPVDRLGSYEP